MGDTSANQRARAECVIYARSLRRGYFHWGWRASDGRRSHTVFNYFYDCLSDARRHGYEVDPAEVVRQLCEDKLSIHIVPTVTPVHEPQT